MPQIVFGPDAARLDHEWLVPDGQGGHASGTANGLRTRPGHGLLTVAGNLALAALDLTLTLPSGAKVPLYTHRWADGATAPAGHLLLETFALVDGLPRWRWRVGDVVVERELAMRHGHPSLAVVHRVVAAPGPVGVALAVMCRWPEAGSTGPALKVEQVAGGVVVEDAYRIDGPGWQPGGEWHLGAQTDGGAEDLWLAGTYVQRVNPGGTVEISAWAGDLAAKPPPAIRVIAAAAERNRRIAGPGDGTDATLRLAADAFGHDVPMAAYEGLFLATGRADEGRELLRARLHNVAETESLWLVHAVDRHVTRTGDTDLAAELAGPLARLLRRTLADLVDPADELVRTDGGKPVAVNALWVNALAALGALRTAAGRDGAEPQARHDRARRSFADRFPAPEGWLHDLVEGPVAAYPLGAGTCHDDPTLRPHQLLAWSLPHAPLPGDASALRAIGPSLLTPLGLRTLSPDEYGYQPATCDGQVRPWLIGPWADACAAAGLPTDGLLAGLEAHLPTAGLGSISESAHGDPPHRPSGSPFSALSVAEVLRVRERYT